MTESTFSINGRTFKKGTLPIPIRDHLARIAIKFGHISHDECLSWVWVMWEALKAWRAKVITLITPFIKMATFTIPTV
jgi:hypothetical protein